MNIVTFLISFLLKKIISPTISIIESNTEPITSIGAEWYNKPITDNTIKPSINDAMKYVNYAAAALCTNTSLQNWSCKPCQNVQGTELITTFSNKLLGTDGYLAVNDDEQAIILAFRSTQDLENWISDLELVEIPFSSANGIGARVHSGFLGAMESLSGSFLKALKIALQNQDYKAYKIKVVGHSLGGAMACLGMIKAKDKLNLSWDRFELYTYGQPRVGNVEFAEWFDALPITVARSVNYNDPVPRLPPPSIFRYAHHANELFVNRTSASYCDSSVLEDPNCTLRVPDTKLFASAHLTYYNIPVSASKAC
ncbi:alpha/beta-hydrolase [Neoconidiobolus thromboides FSU 785]|nr:alpha/beta-hydrolase [Neoconidiobolus thromboides FSU 785]